MSTGNNDSQIAQRATWIAVWVAALGYFVDVFDMWLFSNFRVASLQSMGLSGDDITFVGAKLLNYQLAGFIVGGFIWGTLGDKRGRASVMFGSIFLYSTATLLNAFVTSIDQYAWARFISGVGLAGEIGAGITLVAELLPERARGWGTTLVTSLGVAGALGAAIAAKLTDWKTAYIIGGLMGYALLALRIFVHESGLFDRMRENKEIVTGSLLVLFGSWRRAGRYLACIVVGMPIYVVFSLFATFAPEIAKSMGITTPVVVADVMLLAGIGMTIGDFLAGSSSQIFRSRKKPIYLCLILGGTALIALCCSSITSSSAYAMMVGVAALFCGCWACVITTTAEQFGTNLRATATTTVPNLIRGSAIIMTMGFTQLKSYGLIAVDAALCVALAVYAAALLALLFLRETYAKNLDFIEK